MAAMPVLVTYKIALPEGVNPRLFVVLHRAIIGERSFRKIPC